MPGDHSSSRGPLTLTPIGYLRAAWANKVEAPRQPAAAADAPGVIELVADMNLEHAIEDLAGWERIWVIFWFHRNRGWRPKVLPPRAASGRKGVLATRSPHRPNPLGLSVLRLERVEGRHLHVRDVDMLDGTPILDIKPYVAYTDAFADSASGWLAADPRPSWQVRFSARADAQLQWLDARVSPPLRERIESVLKLGPQPHPYRRIRRLREGGGMQLAVQEWRADFRVLGQSVEVTALRSGYRAAELQKADAGADDPLNLHREFSAQFA